MYFKIQIQYSLIKTIISVILRVLFYDLIGDIAIINNTISKEIKKKLKMMLMFKDSSIIVDMKINNSFKEIKFNCF